MPVRLKEIRIERPRRFGDVYLALALWRGMGLEQLCEQLLPVGKERVAWASMAAVLVTARFCEPSSELHIAEDWYRRTALCDLLQLGQEQVNKDRLCIALVVTFDGFPLGYEVFAGNTHDSRTLQTIVATMEARHGMLGRVWIEGVEVKLARDPDTGETAILCRSADRRSKEQAMHDRFSQRIEAALERLAGRIARAKKPLDAAAVNRQIGRLMQRNQRAAARFVVRLQPDASPAGFHLRFARSAAFDDWAALSEGAYLLRSNIADWTDRQLWKAYIQLTQVEAAFRIQKDQLNVRPIWHQREDRVQAHILVCFLAFVLWKCLEMWQSRAGLGNTPGTILEELARIQSHDVALPTATHGVIRLRCVTQPDAAQAALLDRLGLVLPKRMRRDQQEMPVLSLSA